MFGKVASFLGGGIIKGVNDLGKTFLGSKAERDAASSREQMAVMQSHGAEFNYRENRTWWDSLIDGINRLPRPILTFGTIALFIWAVVDPVEFVVSMQALTVVPQMLWAIFLTIIGFWFGGKILERVNPSFKMPTLADAKKVMQLRKERNKEKKFQEDMEDESTPLSNDSIMEWNKRHGKR
jgi:hypothetical protein